MHLQANSSDTVSMKTVSKARSNLAIFSQSISAIHTMNYVSSPSQKLLEFVVGNSQVKIIPLPGSGGFKSKNVSFWDMGNDFVISTAAASLISLSELSDPDYMVDAMSIGKRAIVYM